MPLTCPKCGHVRPPDAAVPETECPACGVIYAKAQPRPQAHEARPIVYADKPAPQGGLVKWLLVAGVVAYGGWLGHRNFERHHAPAGSEEAVAAGEIDPDADSLPTDALRAFAARVKAGDVVMYSTTECGYCTQAKGWLNGNGFAFTECNMSVERHCIDEFRSYHADGTPFLVVRGQLMREGFDAHQFLRILKQTDGKA
jgi:glutaredoxin/predicted  nucleic acid-binding Zn-ribbon protein